MHEDPEEMAAINKMIYRYKKGAIKRGLTYELTDEQFKEIVSGECYYCGYDGVGIDRIDNSRGYVEGNCRPCCWTCNKLKSDSSDLAFVRYCAHVVGHCGWRYLKDEELAETLVEMIQSLAGGRG